MLRRIASPIARPALLLALALASVLPAMLARPARAAEPAPAPAPIAELRARLAAFDHQRATWESGFEEKLRSAPSAVDGVVRTVSDDLRELVLNSPASRSRSATRDRLVAALDANALETARPLLTELETGLERDSALALAIIRYWTVRPAYVANRTRFERWRAAHALTAADVAALGPQFERFDRQIAQHEFAAAMRETYPELERQREQIWSERGTALARAAGGAGGAGAAELLDWHARSRACPPFIAVGSGLSRPRVDGANSPATEAYYPVDSASRGEEGVVTLWVEVSEAGCPERAFTLVPSGFERLDQAALEWVFDAHFLSAEEDHRYIAAALPVRLRFTVAQP